MDLIKENNMNEIELYWDCTPDLDEGIKITLYPSKQKDDFETVMVKKEDFSESLMEIEDWYNEYIDGSFDFNEDYEDDKDGDEEKYESLVWQKLEESGRIKECLSSVANNDYDNYDFIFDLVPRAEQILTNQGNSVEELYLIAAVNQEKFYNSYINKINEDEDCEDEIV